jgi:AcrR family transcriptional regulator
LPVTSAPIEQLPRRGRTAATSAPILGAQRDRIIHATAQTVHAKGYEKMTVADIIAAAGLSREIFYAHFHNKRQAFAAVAAHGYEQAIGNCARAFFVSESAWPDRVWDATEAMATFLASNPSLAYASLVEGYVLGPDVLRTDEMMLSYTVFLEDGYSYRPEAARTPRLVGEAIGGATHETVDRVVRHGCAKELPTLLPLITYMMLAPFTGTTVANEVVDRKLAEQKRKRKPTEG